MCFAGVQEEYSREGYKYYEQDILDSNVDDDKSSDTEDTNLFERIAKKMVDITPDGGVKKQTVVHGIGEVVPRDANVISNCILWTTTVASGIYLGMGKLVLYFCSAINCLVDVLSV